jgi:phosphatidylserine/phosphatidylglycerophosphate/cardiolipin synthase-like enzyme
VFDTIKAVSAIFLAVLAAHLSGCASTAKQPPYSPFEATQALLDHPPEYSQEGFIHKLYLARSWVPYKELEEDPIVLSKRSQTPVQEARTKIVGPSYQDSLRSLAAKLWMIEHAEHTIDLTYYIFKYDPTGYAILGALCNAVKRGVDVRIMVDSLGSMHASHTAIRAVETCAEEAGYIRDVNGEETPYRARVQFVIINALTSVSSWANRRSHDKLMIKDGNFPGKDIVMTGGRNVSVDYYGINKDGSRNPDTYLDLEILLRSKGSGSDGDSSLSVGEVSGIYYSLLFLHKGNRRIYPVTHEDEDQAFLFPDPYAYERQKAQDALDFIKGIPAIQAAFTEMSTFLSEGFHLSEVRLAHEMGNLVSEDVVTNVFEIKARNTNSIGALLANMLEEAARSGVTQGNFRVVSPYLFIAKYQDDEGNVFFDGAEEMVKLLDTQPGFSFEIVTNSVLTSDNFFTQSVIDMDTAPRLLLSPEMQQTWLSSRRDSEFNPAFVGSDEWKRLVNHPRIKIYQTGKLDAVLLGGTEVYGKLHAKFFFDDEFGFVGTSNFDYRSRLYNNEMGFYYLDPKLSQDLNEIFEQLKAISLPWGSPEWLEMRKRLVERGGFKGYTTGTQRGLYKMLKGTGLIWLF